ncbi:MAG: hypothetical protein ACHQWU_13375, partial [Gemmatimonadales bacterium]
MSGLLGLRGIQKPDINGMYLASSIVSAAIPLVYGQARITGNLIQFPEQPKTDTASKVARRMKGTVATNRYFAPVIIGLCEGPIAGIGRVWQDVDDSRDFGTYYQPQRGWGLLLGTAAQTAWTWIAGAHPDQALNYPHLAYVVNQNLDLPNGSVPQLGWEINGLFQVGGLVLDANAADIITDYLTDVTHGLAWPSAKLADLTAYR